MSRPQDEATGTSTLAPGVSDLEDLFREYHPRVYAYVRYRVADVSEAEDLTSEILERALKYLASYDARKGAFSTWLFRIAHNTYVNYVKRQQRRAPYQLDFNEGVEDLVADEPDPEQVLVQREAKIHLLGCLNTLPTRQQEILTLRFAGQLTNREIASVLKMNERTVSVYILRALRKLRQQLTGGEVE
jgi:RNA polymerase sigma-70 factor (ECF subfamily)